MITNNNTYNTHKHMPLTHSQPARVACYLWPTAQLHQGSHGPCTYLLSQQARLHASSCEAMPPHSYHAYRRLLLWDLQMIFLKYLMVS